MASAAVAAQPQIDRRSREYVRWLQESLNRVSGVRLQVDGVMGPATRSALRSFQQSRGLAADGIPGPATDAALRTAGAGSPPSAQVPSGPAAPGQIRILKQETDPAARTVYLDIPLGGEAPARAMTGVYFPERFTPSGSVNAIVYLHGHHRFSPSLAIDGHWNRTQLPHFALREALNETRKNVLLIAPTLGPRSEAGRLVGAGGFDRYLSDVFSALGAQNLLPRGASPGTLVLACHSGGGLPMRRIALGLDAQAQRIRECWGFDCLYNTGDPEYWARWAKSKPGVRLFVYYLGSTEKFSTQLRAMRVPNVTVERSTARGHNWVPLAHLKERVRQALFL